MSDTRAYYSPPGTTAVTTDDGGTFTPRAESERDTIARLTRERDALRRELHRLAHGEAIEGDGVCEHELRANEARRWSRLWHAEARRLWREVQDLTDELLEVIDGQ